jgi:hypothetical protein
LATKPVTTVNKFLVSEDKLILHDEEIYSLTPQTKNSTVIRIAT